jgi:hypothetical protein
LDCQAAIALVLTVLSATGAKVNAETCYIALFPSSATPTPTQTTEIGGESFSCYPVDEHTEKSERGDECFSSESYCCGGGAAEKDSKCVDKTGGGKNLPDTEFCVDKCLGRRHMCCSEKSTAATTAAATTTEVKDADAEYKAFDETTSVTTYNCATAKPVGTYSTITTKTECEEAAKALGLTFKEEMNTESRPPACHTASGGAFFNSNLESTDTDTHDKLICKEGSADDDADTEKPTSTTAATTTDGNGDDGEDDDEDDSGGKKCALTYYTSPGEACNGLKCDSSNAAKRCCPGGQDEADATVTYATGDPNEWQEAPGGTDFIRASSPNCQYEISTESGGGGTTHTCTGDCFLGLSDTSNVLGGWDRLKSVRMVTQTDGGEGGDDGDDVDTEKPTSTTAATTTDEESTTEKPTSTTAATTASDDKKTFFVGPEAKQYAASKAYCEDNGGKIATVLSAAEDEAAVGVCRAGGNNNRQCWVGLEYVAHVLPIVARLCSMFARERCQIALSPLGKGLGCDLAPPPFGGRIRKD